MKHNSSLTYHFSESKSKKTWMKLLWNIFLFAMNFRKVGSMIMQKSHIFEKTAFENLHWKTWKLCYEINDISRKIFLTHFTLQSEHYGKNLSDFVYTEWHNDGWWFVCHIVDVISHKDYNYAFLSQGTITTITKLRMKVKCAYPQCLSSSEHFRK